MKSLFTGRETWVFFANINARMQKAVPTLGTGRASGLAGSSRCSSLSWLPLRTQGSWQSPHLPHPPFPGLQVSYGVSVFPPAPVSVQRG